ncbi:MAG: O-antigen ligase protein [Ramlibacter sp.]|nr:O-antigen ligase protein [Ramlibacter sp.]
MKSLGFAAATSETGPIGPVSFSVLLVLVIAAPLMRGGNRQIALIVLEGIALAFLVAIALRGRYWAGMVPQGWPRVPMALLALSPLWLAVVYLLPVPAAVWSATAGRGSYLELLDGAGIAHAAWLPLSLAPDATAVSLYAGIPVLAAFLGGYLARMRQLRTLLQVFVALSFLQVGFGLLQIATGTESVLYFGSYGGRPVGTFANANHFANYVAMGLAAYVWLGWTKISEARQDYTEGRAPHPPSRNMVAFWIGGGVLLVLGVLMSRSRGAAVGGLLCGLLAFALTLTLGSRRTQRWGTTLAILATTVVAAVSMVGLNFIVTRFELIGLVNAASIRGMLAAGTFDGAAYFWPWGAGWGTYAVVFPRFQPSALVGFAEYAHHDYAQLLFEGGIFALLLMAAFAWLAGARAVLLTRTAMRQRRLGRLEMVSAICGLGLLGFLLHSIVEFNMHIPANAIAAALLAGVFLRPMKHDEEGADD